MTMVAQFLLEDLVDVVNTYVADASGTMLAIVAGTASSLMAIYVLLWGAGIASGTIQEPFTDGAKRIVRMTAIMSLGLSAGFYQGEVTDFFTNTPVLIAQEMVTPGSTSGGDVASIATMLDTALGKGIEVGDKAWDKANEAAGWGPEAMAAALGFYLLALIVYLISAVIVGVAGALVFIAMIAMAVLLAVGPLFIMLAIFPQTQRFFEAWTAQLVNFALLYILVAVTTGLCFTMLDGFFTQMLADTWNEAIINTIKIVGACVGIIAVLLQTRAIASGLGGGVALAAQGLAGRLASMGSDAARVGATGSSRLPIGDQIARTHGGVVGHGRAAYGGAKAAAGRARRAFGRSNSVTGS